MGQPKSENTKWIISGIVSITVLLTGTSSLAFAKTQDNNNKKLSVKPAKVVKAPARPTLGQIQRDLRLQHSQELLGRYYRKSAVRSGESVEKINSQVYRWTFERLPKKYRPDYQRVAQTIIDESLKYEFDPVFLMSVVQSESSFKPDRLGGVGEIGLMQIRPTTAEWIAKKYGLKYKGEKSLYDPVTNIRIGAAFLSYLRDRFDSHARLYLAAYNMGQSNVDRLQEKNIWPEEYPVHVMRNYVDFYSGLPLPISNPASATGVKSVASKSAAPKAVGTKQAAAKNIASVERLKK